MLNESNPFHFRSVIILANWMIPDYDSTMFPKECVDNAQYACIPEPAFDDYVFRSGTFDKHDFVFVVSLSNQLIVCSFV
jgi:hypothetical protein